MAYIVIVGPLCLTVCIYLSFVYSLYLMNSFFYIMIIIIFYIIYRIIYCIFNVYIILFDYLST